MKTFREFIEEKDVDTSNSKGSAKSLYKLARYAVKKYPGTVKSMIMKLADKDEEIKRMLDDYNAEDKWERDKTDSYKNSANGFEKNTDAVVPFSSDSPGSGEEFG